VLHERVVLAPPLTPILARPADVLPREGELPGDLCFEAKMDGFRAIGFVREGTVLLQGRRGGDLTRAFPEIAQALVALGVDLVVDGELVVHRGGRIDFSALQQRARRTGSSADHLAAELPAHLAVFDLLSLEGADFLDQPYRERRRKLEDLIETHGLGAPWALAPSTADRRRAEEWLDPVWSAAGVEGVVSKGSEQKYTPGYRGWVKVRSRHSAEAVIGAVTGLVPRPSALLLGRYDAAGRLRLVARTTPLPGGLAQRIGERLVVAGSEHPWFRARFSAGWGRSEVLQHTCVQPHLVLEIEVDTAVDAGHWRHPVRAKRLRTDMAPGDVPGFPAAT
jgi:ATP-dependent DNA ligase